MPSAENVLAVLKVLRARYMRRCQYMRQHVRPPFHQIAYEDLDNASSR